MRPGIPATEDREWIPEDLVESHPCRDWTCCLSVEPRSYRPQNPIHDTHASQELRDAKQALFAELENCDGRVLRPLDDEDLAELLALLGAE